jgi:gas vesicle protein
MSNGHSDSGIAFAFLAGALLGAGVALLLAPKPGTETRVLVAEWLKEAQQKAKDLAGSGNDPKASEKLDGEPGKA